MKIGIPFSFKHLCSIALFCWSWLGFSQAPACTALSIPSNDGFDVALDFNFEWVASAGAESYILIVGTSSGATDILDNVNVGNVTEYDLPNNLPGGETIFVKIIPQNTDGQNVNCDEISFTTTTVQVPDCAEWVFPVNGSIDTNPDITLEWNEVPNIDGFILSVGTSLNEYNIVNSKDVGDRTSYDLMEDLPMGAIIYVKVDTYKGDEISETCPIISFRVESSDSLVLMDGIPKFFTPNSDGFNDSWVITSTEDIRVDKIFIYNRYGQLLKQMGEGQSWDGTLNGRILPAASYWYSVELVNAPAIKGFFLLKR